MKTTLTLTPKQCRLVQAALEQELRKGSSTFLSGRDSIELDRMITVLKYATQPQQEATQ
jgi:uncharacterized protein YaaQ